MINSFEILGRSIQVTPSRVAAFGVAVGGLFALMILNLAGAGAVTDWAPAWAFAILAQGVGAAVGLASAARRG